MKLLPAYLKITITTHGIKMNVQDVFEEENNTPVTKKSSHQHTIALITFFTSSEVPELYPNNVLVVM